MYYSLEKKKTFSLYLLLELLAWAIHNYLLAYNLIFESKPGKPPIFKFEWYRSNISHITQLFLRKLPKWLSPISWLKLRFHK